MRSKTKRMALCALMVALMVVGSFIRIPTPIAPITLQMQIALLSGVLLGGWWGSLSVLLYAFLGLLGLPFFAGGGGIAYLLQPTFGFVIGFAVAALVVGEIARRKVVTYGKIAMAFAVGLLITYVVGMAYSALILTVYLQQTLIIEEFLFGYLLLTLPKDILLTALAVPFAKYLFHHVL